jgi:hypothetical protein
VHVLPRVLAGELWRSLRWGGQGGNPEIGRPGGDRDLGPVPGDLETAFETAITTLVDDTCQNFEPPG